MSVDMQFVKTLKDWYKPDVLFNNAKTDLCKYGAIKHICVIVWRQTLLLKTCQS
jgi:hypothetical protein